jgi:hypothetical protein
MFSSYKNYLLDLKLASVESTPEDFTDQGNSREITAHKMPSGRCLCDTLRYEYSGEPVMKVRKYNDHLTILLRPTGIYRWHTQQVLCHCLTCRKISGSTNTVCLLVPEQNFRFTSGNPKKTTVTHETGMKITLSFCGDCGNTLCKQADAEAFQGHTIVCAGTLDDDDHLKIAQPMGELWVKYRASWLPEIAGAKQYQEFS